MAQPDNAVEKEDAPTGPVVRGRRSWWLLGVFALAFAARLAFIVVVDPGPTDAHQYKTYYWNGLRIAGHARPLEYVLMSDGWHTWDAPIMTVAPLYHLMLGAFFRLFGTGLLGLRLFQAGLGALAAVGVASLGRRLAGRHGAWAGVAYAVHWPALEMSCWTLTENLHTPLLVIAFAVLAAGADGRRGEEGRDLPGGLLLGLSALARSVSSAFAPLVLVWRLTAEGLSPAALRRNLRPTLLVALGCLLAVLPWAARNRLLLGKDVVIETVGFFNLWDDNARGLVSNDRYVRQFEALLGQEEPAGFGRAAADFAWRNILRNPDAFVAKVQRNFWHFLRPERLYNLLVKEAAYSEGPWLNGLRLLLDDALLMLALPLFAAFVLGGRPSPTRRLIVSWTAYYLVITLVAFHSEVRYRSALTPFVLAGAAGGLASVVRSARGRRPLAWAGLLVGVVLVVTVSWGELRSAREAVASYRAFQPAVAAVERGDPASAMRIAAAAADLDRGAMRPWLRCGRLMASHGHTTEAIVAYERALRATDGLSWTAILALPRLLLASGRWDDASRASDAVNLLSLRADPSALLELAWRELPPPRADEILVGENDYGAARGFHGPRGIGETPPGAPLGERRTPPGPHRWSRGRAWVRLRPIERAEAYDVAITMGSPFPSTRSHPVVEVRVNGGAPTRIELGPEVRAYHVSASLPTDETLVVRLDAPTWTRVGEEPDQGVRVDALRIAPATGPVPLSAAPIDLGYSHQTAFAVEAPDLERLGTFLAPALDRNRRDLVGATGKVHGFGAGDVYPQIWLRDSATLLPLSRYLYPREYLASWLEEHFAHQGPKGELLDWVAAGPVSAFAPWAPRAHDLSAPGSPPLAGDTNSVEADQEASAVLGLSQVFSITGDRGWLLKKVGGRPLLERADRALRYPLAERMDARLGLIISGFSADWGDVSPIHADQQAIYLDPRTPLVTGLYTNALFVDAATRFADVCAASGDDGRASYWRTQARVLKARVNERLWQEPRGFYRMHRPSGPVAPPAFDDSDLFAMGGNAIALLAGIADEGQARRILTVADRRREAHGVSTIAGVLLPPYPRGLFKHPAMAEEYSYQNGGQWDWFSGRLLSAAFVHGQSDWARRNLLDVAKRVTASGGIYEWSTREGQGRGSSAYAGSAGALAQAVFEGLFGISLAAEGSSITVRLGDLSGRIHLYQPATDTYMAYDYRASPATLELRYESNHPRAGHVSVLVPGGRRIVAARWDGKPVAFEQAQRGDDTYATIPTDWAPHRLSLETSSVVREPPRTTALH